MPEEPQERIDLIMRRMEQKALQNARNGDRPAKGGVLSEGYDIYLLRRELAVARALSAAAGTINPRPPGLHNQAIQFFKKLIRKLISWYSRPLQQFDVAMGDVMAHQVRVLQALSDRFDEIEERLADVESEQNSLVRRSRTMNADDKDAKE